MGTSLAPSCSSTHTPSGPLLILLLSLFSCIAESALPRSRASPAVSLGKDKVLRGLEITFKHRRLQPVKAFYGVRYASLEKLRTGTVNRFRSGVAPFVTEEVSGLQYKTKMPHPCPQVLPQPEILSRTQPKVVVNHIRRILSFLRDSDEECLTLNIYTPTTETKEPYPVMLFVHGESYEYGSGNAYDPSVLVSFGEIIVITMNYRLGVLGFFATPSGQGAMGNYALLDLQAALQWISNYIRNFGGNPKNVTLFGHGYGAALVNLFLASNLARGNFGIKRAILLDGSALAPWATSRYFHDFSTKLASSFNCTPHDLFKKLRVMSVKEILGILETAPNYRFITRLGPVESPNLFPGGDLRASLDGKPFRVRGGKLVHSKFRDIDLLIGVTKSAAYGWLKNPRNGEGMTHKEFDRQLRTFVRNNFAFHQQKLYHILGHMYIDWSKLTSSNPMEIKHSLLVSWLNLLTDAMYNAPAFEVAAKHAAAGKANTFVYVFAHHSNIPEYPQWTSALHGDDLMYIFGAPILRNEGVSPFPKQFILSERGLAGGMMRFISNFVKSGDPNVPSNSTFNFGKHIQNLLMSKKWPKYEKEFQRSFYISQAPHYSKHVVSHYRTRYLPIWQSLIPVLHRNDGLPSSYHRFINHSNLRLFDSLSAFVEENSKLSTPSLLAVPPSPLPGEATGTRPVVQQTGGKSEKGTETTLIWTIVAGCALLALNVLVFMGIYYQVFRQCARADPGMMAQAAHATSIATNNNSYKPRGVPAAYMSLKQREEMQLDRGVGSGITSGGSGTASTTVGSNTMVGCCSDAVELCPDVTRRCQSPGGSVQLTCVDRSRGQPITMV